MWAQGGGGAGGCCCGVGSYGGQGGTYGWVTCTTSATNQILCACACICTCMNCDTICTGHVGQCSRVTQCNAPSTIWLVCGGAAGTWCCTPSSPSPWCWQGATSGSSVQGKYNTYLFWKNNSAALANTATTTTGTSSASNLQGSNIQTFTDEAIAYIGCCSCAPPSTSAFTGLNTTNLWGCLCTCATFSSPYVWRGACGWSDTSTTSTPYACLNSASASAGVPNAACGFGVGVGGAAYAGGDQAFFGTALGSCFSPGCWSQNGNFPGGGGMTAWTQTAQGTGSCGGYGLILISWC